MARRQARFVKEIVVLVGFLHGVWVAVGVNPGAQLLDALAGLVEHLLSGVPVRALVALVPIVGLSVVLGLVVRRAGWRGVLAVLLAFLGGAQVVASPVNALLLLGAGLVLGYVAAK